MKTAIIASEQDPAGMNIVEVLKAYDLGRVNAEIHVVKESIIHADGLDESIDVDLFVFASKHASKMGTPSFSCHVTGNFGKAEFGGKDKQLSVAPALLLKKMFIELFQQGKGKDYEITLEATHHGPLNSTPSMFIEIGSTEKEWIQEENGKIIASVIVNVLGTMSFLDAKEMDVVVGIGGGHYCPTFNKIQLEKNIALGHIIPKYHLEHLKKEMILQAVERTLPRADYVILDWKGLGKAKQHVVSLLDELGIRYVRSDKIE